MLSFEWRELEALSERLSDLRHRYADALVSRHHGLVEGLKKEIAKVRRQREFLVRHISARLSVVAAAHSHHHRQAEKPEASDRSEPHS